MSETQAPEAARKAARAQAPAFGAVEAARGFAAAAATARQRSEWLERITAPIREHTEWLERITAPIREHTEQVERITAPIRKQAEQVERLFAPARELARARAEHRQRLAAAAVLGGRSGTDSLGPLRITGPEPFDPFTSLNIGSDPEGSAYQADTGSPETRAARRLAAPRAPSLAGLAAAV